MASANNTSPSASSSRLTHDAWFVLRRSALKFKHDECPDTAAALTFYSVLSLFPALIAVISLVGLVGDGPATVRTLLRLVEQIGADSAVSAVEGPLTSIAEARRAAGFALVLGLLSALWTASGYVGAFGRAINRIYGMDEGRPFWKLRPYQLLVTLVALVCVGAVALALAMSGSVVDAVGDELGIGSAGLLVWRIVKWPLLLVAVAVIVSVLYYATPNVKHPQYRWIGFGAVAAILGWVVASVGFAIYVANFSSYNKVYGSLAAVVVLLLWVWLTNMALLLGAELNAELERLRQLRAGLPAEESLQLQARDTSGIKSAEDKRSEDVQAARQLRSGAGQKG